MKKQYDGFLSLIQLIVPVLLVTFGCDTDSKWKVANLSLDTDTIPELIVDTDVDGQNHWEPRFDDLAAQIDAERVSVNASGAAFAVVENGQVVFAAGFGNRQPGRDDTPVVDTTLFRIGSVTKVLTATAVLTQVEKGGLSLHTPVVQTLPAFVFAENPDWSARITLHMALAQTSGQFDYSPFTQLPDDTISSIYAWYLDNLWIMSPPGAFWNYANPNYALGGWLLEEVSGTSYREYLRQSVLIPLGMTRTFMDGKDVMLDGNYAIGTTVDWNTQTGSVSVLPDSYDNPFMGPAGNGFADVYDMARFMGFLMNGDEQVLSEDLQNEMVSGQVSTQNVGDLEQYGYGLFVHEGIVDGDGYHSVKVISHGGDMPGFAADIMCLPEHNSGVVSLASGDGAHLLQSMGQALKMLVSFPEAEPVPAEYESDPSAYPDYEGVYLDSRQVGQMIVSLKQGNLQVAFPDLDVGGISYSSLLVPLAKDNFILLLEDTAMPLTFIRDDTGNIAYVRHRFFVAIPTDDVSPRIGQPTLRDFSLLRQQLRQPVSRSLIRLP